MNFRWTSIAAAGCLAMAAPVGAQEIELRAHTGRPPRLGLGCEVLIQHLAVAGDRQALSTPVRGRGGRC